MMKIEEVITLLRNGDKIRKPFWGKDQYLRVEDGLLRDQDGKARVLDVYFDDSDWEVIEVEIEHGIYVDCDGDVYLYNGQWYEYELGCGWDENPYIDRNWINRHSMILEIPGEFTSDCKIEFKPTVIK